MQKSMIQLLSITAVLVAFGCTGPENGRKPAEPVNEPQPVMEPRTEPAAEMKPEPMPPPEEPERFEEILEPDWLAFSEEDGVRLVPGSGLSRKSSEEALEAAENKAFEEAARIVGVAVRGEWEQRIREVTRNDNIFSESEIKSMSRTFTEEPILGASMKVKQVLEGNVYKGEKVIGTYWQGFALLEVPEENFEFSPARCLRKAHSLSQQGAGEAALRALEAAHLCWPGDIDVLGGLAILQEKAGRLGDALQSMQKLRHLGSPKDEIRLDAEIKRLEREYAGGEFAYQEKSLRQVLDRAADPNRLKVDPLTRQAKAGGSLWYTVRSDMAYDYYGLWLDEEGLFLYPAHESDTGTRLGSAEGAESIELPVGQTPGEHLFVLLAATERPDWFEEKGFLKVDVNRRAQNAEGNVPHEELAELIQRLREGIAEKKLVMAFFDFEVSGR